MNEISISFTYCIAKSVSIQTEEAVSRSKFTMKKVGTICNKICTARDIMLYSSPF